MAEVDTGDPVVVQAVMGSGKSAVIAELIHAARLESGERIVVTTSSRQLVQQLADTLASRVGWAKVGRYFSGAKNIHAPIIVTCTPSAPKLARALKAWGGVTCAMWIADEVHRTECDVVKACYETLRPKRAIGFTATPYRGRKGEELSLWQRLIFRYGPREALRDGVVVPWRIVPWTGDEALLDDVCVAMVSSAEGPGVVSASSIEDAEAFAARLCDAGISAAAVHSRLGTERVSERLTLLERGQLKALVHVALLQEGVDMPWLRWLCLRRPVRSAVRFAQEVGRVLRAAPDKTEAVLYDPNDLFGVHRLSQEAVLQGMAEGKTTTLAAPPQPIRAPRRRRDTRERMARALETSEAYLRNLVVALDQCGLVDESPDDGAWRHEPISTRQLQAIERHAWMLRVVRGLPSAHRSMLREVYAQRRSLKKGSASDLLSIVFALPAQGWPEEASRLVPLPEAALHGAALAA